MGHRAGGGTYDTRLPLVPTSRLHEGMPRIEPWNVRETPHRLAHGRSGTLNVRQRDATNILWFNFERQARKDGILTMKAY